jgi:hypothetical protein
VQAEDGASAGAEPEAPREPRAAAQVETGAGVAANAEADEAGAADTEADEAADADAEAAEADEAVEETVPDDEASPDEPSAVAVEPAPDEEPTPAEPEPESTFTSASDEAAPDESPAGRRSLAIAPGIGCAALLLPLIAVAGAIGCFAAGILSAATGCSPNGSALCSSDGPWFAFVLPLFVSPLIAAATAIGAVTVRKHRSTWLAVGYGIVFISVIVGLASASTGST